MFQFEVNFRHTKIYLNSDSVDKISDEKSDKKHVTTVDTMKKKDCFNFLALDIK